MPPPERVLICALSGRALAQAARAAGFAPIVLDAFGDLDTRAVAEAWQRVPVDGRWRFHRGSTPGGGEAPGTAAHPPGLGLRVRACAGAAGGALRGPRASRQHGDRGACGEGPSGLRCQRDHAGDQPPRRARHAARPTVRAGYASAPAAPAAAMSAGPASDSLGDAAGTGSGGPAVSPCPRSSSATARTPACSPSASSSSRRGLVARSGSPACSRQRASRRSPDRRWSRRRCAWPSTTACEAWPASTRWSRATPSPCSSSTRARAARSMPMAAALGVNLFALHVGGLSWRLAARADGGRAAARDR